MSDEERKTDPISKAPPSDRGVAPLKAMPPAARVPAADPNSFEHLAMQTIIDGMAELKVARAAFDADELLSRQTEVFAQIVTDRYEMIRVPIVNFGAQLEQLVKRVDKHDDRLDEGSERFEKIEQELAAMRSQMERLEQLRPHLDRLEKMLLLLKKEGIDVTEAADEAKRDPG